VNRRTHTRLTLQRGWPRDTGCLQDHLLLDLGDGSKTRGRDEGCNRDQGSTSKLALAFKNISCLTTSALAQRRRGRDEGCDRDQGSTSKLALAFKNISCWTLAMAQRRGGGTKVRLFNT